MSAISANGAMQPSQATLRRGDHRCQRGEYRGGANGYRTATHPASRHRLGAGRDASGRMHQREHIVETELQLHGAVDP